MFVSYRYIRERRLKATIEQEPRYLLRAGFTKYQSVIIDTLLREGEMTAFELSQKTGIPRNKIYQIFKEMKENGADFLVMAQERPKRLGVDTEKLYFALKTDYPELVNPLRDYYESKKWMSPEILEPLEVEVAEEHTRERYREAKSEIRIVTRTMGYLDRVRKGLLVAAAKKPPIKLRVLFAGEEFVSPQSVEQDYIQARTKDLKLMFQDVIVRYLDKEKLRAHGIKQVQFHGSLMDPKDNGTAIFIIENGEETEVPVAMTNLPGFVQTLNFAYLCLWRYCSRRCFRLADERALPPEKPEGILL